MKSILLTMVAIAISLTSGAQSRWWRYASLPEGGKVVDLACTNTGKLYMLAPNSVVYYSDNDGILWKKVPGTYDFWNATNIATDKATGTLYIGTVSDGLHWTADNGATWKTEPFHTNSTTGFHAYIATVAAKGGTGNIVAVENLTTAATAYRSSNSGSSWSNSTCPFTTTYKMQYVSNGTLYAGTENGVYKSANDGASFSAANSGMAGLKTTAIAGDNLHLIAGVSFNFSTLDTTGSGVYVSTNGGVGWTKLSAGITDRRIMALAIDSAGQKIYAGTASGGVFMSANWGVSWTAVNTGIGSKAMSGIVSTPSGIFAGSLQSGVAYSANPPTGWMGRNGGLLVSGIARMVLRQSGTVQVLDGGTGGVYSKAAGSWAQQNNGLPAASGSDLAISSSGALYASFLPGLSGISKSVDSGNSWNNVAIPIATSPNITFTSFDAIRTDGANGLYVLVNYHGGSLPVLQEIFHSANGGNSWSSVYKTLDTSSYRINEINVASNGTFYITQFDFGGTTDFLASTDHGLTFTPVAVNLSITSTSANLVIDRHDSLYIIQRNAILRRNGINNWTTFSNGGWSTDPSYHPVKLYFDNANNAFLSCKNDGMYYSTNMTSWTNITQGIPKYDYAPDSVRITLSELAFDNSNTPYALAVDSKAGNLQGIYRFSVPTAVDNKSVLGNELLIYPNPSASVIKYCLRDRRKLI